MDLINDVKKLISSQIEDLGYILDEVKYESEGKSNFLRIIIDKDGFITLDDCVIVSKLVSEILDKNDPIEENYILDVCSKEKGCE